MKRTERMAPVQQVFSTAEKDRARDLGSAQQRLDAAIQKLAELRRYHDDYQVSFEKQARDGCGAAALRDFQLFIARLNLALRQQEQLVEHARRDLAAHSARWQTAARRSRALDSVVGRWQGEERRIEDHNEQLQSDERAQRRGVRGNGGDH